MLMKKNMMIILLFLTTLCVSMVYVTAAEIQLEPAVEVSSGTSTVFAEDLEKKAVIRMANEDAIEVSALVEPGRHSLNSREYGILTRIVEAEATSKDKKSKILVANVVLNRMKSDEFPDTVEGVVFQKVGGVVQFSPIADGRYYTVSVTESTRECVDRALSGEDYSEGALYFMERTMSSPQNIAWFDSALTRLFVYEGHEFYR